MSEYISMLEEISEEDLDELQQQAKEQYDRDCSRLELTKDISDSRLRELAEAERKGKIKIGSDWTPCAEGLPDAFDGEPKDAPWYLCSKKNGTRCILIYQKRGAVDNWRTITGLGISDSVIAYMPLPSPYNTDTAKEDNADDHKAD